jgi:WD40 repeat protein
LAWHAGDGSVRLAEVATGRQTVLAPAGAAFRMPLGFTPDSRRLVTHALEGPVVVWGVPTGQEVARYPGSWATALAPDGTALATVRPDAVHLIDLADGRDRSVAGLGPGPVQCLAFSPDSATLAVGGGGGTILLYDRATLRQRGSLQGNAGPTLELAFSPDGTALAARYDQRGRAAPEAACEVRLWQLATGQSRLVAAPGTFALGFAPGGRTLATQELDGAVDLWDVASGARRLGLGRSPGAARLYRVVFSPDGKAIVTPAPGGVQLRDTATGRVLATLRGHSGAVGDAAFSGDGRTLATGTGGVPVGDAPARPAEIRLWERVE